MLRVKFLVFSVLTMMYSLVCAAQSDTVVHQNQMALNEAYAAAHGAQPLPNNMAVFMSGLEDLLIPIVGIVTPFLIGFLVVFFILKYQLSKKKAKYAVVEKALEMGKDLPAEFFQSQEKKPKSQLESALILIAIGAGMLVLGFTTSPILYGIGAICILIGIAKFIAWKVEQKKEQSANEQMHE
ncbi:MAG: DUF6249 domain-containing protein [Bacteroidales bacterium]